jgi:hypothetical protein
MNKLETIFKNASESVRMTDAEKARVRAAAFPVPVRPVASPWLVFFRTHVPATAFVALIFFTGATSAIAERSLPGDILYPVKTKVNEPAASLVVRRGPDAETRWEASIAKRRLDEAKALLDNPSGDDEALASAVRAAAEERIARLEELTGTPSEGDNDSEEAEETAAVLMVASLPSEEAPVQAAMMTADTDMTDPADADDDDGLDESTAMKATQPVGDDLPMNNFSEADSDSVPAGNLSRAGKTPSSDGLDRLLNLEEKLADFESSQDDLSLKAQAVFYRAQALAIDVRTALRAGDSEAYEEALKKLSRSIERLESIVSDESELRGDAGR